MESIIDLVEEGRKMSHARDNGDRYRPYERDDISAGRLYDKSDRNYQRHDDRERRRDFREHYESRDTRDRRSNSRDRKRGRDGEIENTRHSGRINEPSSTVVIKGLTGHTNEPTLHAVLGPFYPKDVRLIMQRDGECKGYAFVQFPSMEYAQYFMTTFAGSSGDPKAPQLIVDNRAVTLEYARDQESRPRDGDRDGSRRPPPKTDWLCDQCSCHNFSRRDTCFRCSAARTERSVSIPSGVNAFSSHSATDLDAATNVPSEFLVVKGLSPMVQAEQVKEVYRQYAVVKSVSLIRDPATHFARGLAFVEFHSPEYAQYALQRTNGMTIGGADMAVGGDNAVSVAFARADVMQTLLKKANQPGAALAVNPLVAQALQAAQWSANNGYSTVTAPVNAPPQPPAPLAYPGSIPAYAQLSETTYAGHTAIFEQPLQYPPVPAIPHVPTRFPPNFEDNGGSYVYQAKSGYFLEPTTDFYYDPKNKRYFCGRDGCYYTHDAARSPPYQPFYPPLPSIPNASAAPPSSSVTAALGTKSAELAPAGQLTGQSTAAGIKVKVTSTAAGKSGTGLGFGFGLPVNKKAKLDIAKWGALQQEDEEVPDAAAASKIGSKANPPGEARKAVPAAAPPTDASTAATPVAAAVVPVAPAPPAAPALMQPVVTQAPPPPPAIPAKPVVALPSAGPPVCLICQRQFPSVEVLRRHEKESKLHADNLAKLAAGQPQ